MSLSLIETIALKIAELKGMEPMNVEQFEREKMQPNYSLFDEWADEDERWEE